MTTQDCKQFLAEFFKRNPKENSNQTMIYFKIISHDKELLAIGKAEKGEHTFGDWLDNLITMAPGMISYIKNEMKTGDWFWEHLTQPEFETYQAFGIKEIKL